MNEMKALTRRLRREQTDAEKKLWIHLRDRLLSGFKFRRQHEIGPYVADFCCPGKKLIIELDGSQHMEQALKDQRRTDFLHRKGYQVLRFWDHEALQEPDSVLEAIRLALINPHPHPLPKRERGKMCSSAERPAEAGEIPS